MLMLLLELENFLHLVCCSFCKCPVQECMQCEKAVERHWVAELGDSIYLQWKKMGCSGHAQGCHTEASAGNGKTEEGCAREDMDEDLRAGTHLYVKIVFVVSPCI